MITVEFLPGSKTETDLPAADPLPKSLQFPSQESHVGDGAQEPGWSACLSGFDFNGQLGLSPELRPCAGGVDMASQADASPAGVLCWDRAPLTGTRTACCSGSQGWRCAGWLHREQQGSTGHRSVRSPEAPLQAVLGRVCPRIPGTESSFRPLGAASFLAVPMAVCCVEAVPPGPRLHSPLWSLFSFLFFSPFSFLQTH